MALGRSFALMRGSIWRSIGYTFLAFVIIYSPVLLAAILPSFIMPEIAVRIFVFVFLLADAMFILTYTRMFVEMYTENVAMPKAPEEEE